MIRKIATLWAVSLLLFAVAGVNPAAADGDLLVAGKIGIGTTTPAVAIDISGLPVSSNGIVLRNSTGGARVITGLSYDNGSLLLRNAVSADAVSIQANDVSFLNGGNVGIGTTQPPARLTVAGPGFYPGQVYNNLVTIQDTADAGVGVGGGINFVGNYYHDSYGNIMLDVGSGIKGVKHGAATHNDYNWDLLFWTRQGASPYSLGERMRILYNGNVGIGTASPQYMLDVAGTLRAYGITDSSDIRWKKNIEPVDDALSLVEGLQAVRFDWRTDEFKDKSFPSDRQIGLIAQDVEKKLPELVKTDSNGYKSISYGKLAAVLLAALQEQQQQIESLKGEIEKLKKR